MALSTENLEQLLHEDESVSLDFKREQYPFRKASADQKSELLKDVLAFANAWRHSDAYILIGVEEVRGARSKVVGVSEHLDDASLQQFVNSKTNRPVQFSYHEHILDGKNVGILIIPLQHRPVYLTKDYGKLKKNVVYIRRGSSTDIASLDEISRMGSSEPPGPAFTPTLDLQFYDKRKDQMLGNRLELHTVNIELPQQYEIPEYGTYTGGLLPISVPTANKNYYKDYARYLQVSSHVGRVELAVENRSSVTALDVRVEATVVDQGLNCTVLDATEIPSKPSAGWEPYLAKLAINPDIHVERLSDKWLITSFLGKIQPKAKVHTRTGLFLGAYTKQEITIKADVFADNLPAPLKFTLTAHIIPARKNVTLEDLISLADNEADL
ncbi:MAG: AlbA family DNA-binding domain-containing protein [Candidatus Methanospirareceae archaeon]